MIGQKDRSKLSTFLVEFRTEIKFVLTFTIGLVSCYFLIHWDPVANGIIKPITEMEATIASKVLNVIGFDNRQSNLFISGLAGNPFRMKVLNTCNGVYESVIFLLAFVALQVPWRQKIGWMSIGFIFFHCVNELRLVSLFIVGSNYSHETFVFFHETFWNFAVVLVALLTFIFCANQVNKSMSLKPVESAASND